MNILDNELVLKYFGCDRNCDKYGKSHPDSCAGWIAKQVLLAMQEPISLGESYLAWNRVVQTIDFRTMSPESGWNVYDLNLRLPDKFQNQKPDKVCECGDSHPCAGSYQPALSGCICNFAHLTRPVHPGCPIHAPKPSGEVEDLIDFIVCAPTILTEDMKWLRSQLRTLVALCRKEKTQP